MTDVSGNFIFDCLVGDCAPTGGGGVTSLSSLDDVTITDVSATQLIVWDGTEWVNEWNDVTFLRVYNNTAGTLLQGHCVRITGSHNQNVANVAYAQADSPTTMPSIGVMYADLLPGEEGLAVSYGRAQGADLDPVTFTEGEKLYVSPTTAGEFTNVRPTAGNHLVQNIGVCMKAHPTNGTIKVTGIGRSNDIPNGVITSDIADVDYVYVDDGDVFKKITPTDLAPAVKSDPYYSFIQYKPSVAQNVNQATKSYITFDTVDVAGGDYASDYVLVTANSQIAFLTAGVYEFNINVGLEAGGASTPNQRTATIIRIEHQGVDVGPTAKTGYIRITSGHEEVSHHIAGFIMNISLNDRIKIGSTRETIQTGVVNTIPDETYISIKRIA